MSSTTKNDVLNTVTAGTVAVRPMTRKDMKLKRRVINEELAECAKRKQYKVAYKRFIYALNHGENMYFTSPHLPHLTSSHLPHLII